MPVIKLTQVPATYLDLFCAISSRIPSYYQVAQGSHSMIPDTKIKQLTITYRYWLHPPPFVQDNYLGLTIHISYSDSSPILPTDEASHPDLFSVDAGRPLVLLNAPQLLPRDVQVSRTVLLAVRQAADLRLQLRLRTRKKKRPPVRRATKNNTSSPPHYILWFLFHPSNQSTNRTNRPTNQSTFQPTHNAKPKERTPPLPQEKKPPSNLERAVAVLPGQRLLLLPQFFAAHFQLRELLRVPLPGAVEVASSSAPRHVPGLTDQKPVQRHRFDLRVNTGWDGIWHEMGVGKGGM